MSPTPLVLEHFGQSRSDHAAVPGTPTYGNDSRGRKPRRQPPCSLVQHLVGHGIIHLAFATEACRGRGEENRDLERFDFDSVQKSRHARDLRPVDLGKLLFGLVLDELIAQHAGAVYETGDGSELRAHVGEDVLDRRAIAHIHRVVLHVSGGVGQLAESPANLSMRHEALVFVTHLAR